MEYWQISDLTDVTESALKRREKQFLVKCQTIGLTGEAG